MEGKFAPLPRPANRAEKWDRRAERAQERPGEAYLAAPNGTLNQYKALKMRKTAPFVQDDGHIEVNMRNSEVGEDGMRRGDIFMTWITNEK